MIPVSVSLPDSPKGCRVSKACMWMVSCVQLFVTPWTVACRAPLSMGFSRQEYWSGLPFPPPGDLPPASPALAGRFFTTESPGKPVKESRGF